MWPSVSLPAANSCLSLGLVEAVVEQSGFGFSGWACGSVDVWRDFSMQSLACFLQDSKALSSTKQSNQSSGLGTRPLKIAWATGSMATGAVVWTWEREANPCSFRAMA